VKDTGGLIGSKTKGVVVVDGGSSIEMVVIPQGSFVMGDSKGEGNSYELPLHEVSISSFQMSKYEITNTQYCEFLNAMGTTQGEYGGETVTWIFLEYAGSRIEEENGSYVVESNFENHPVVWVTWYGANAYCEWKGGRLPTEAEWEYAARGGLEDKRFPRGETISHETNGDEQACYSADPYFYDYDVNPTEGTYQDIYEAIEVGTFPPNGYGLYDMSGNVWEWCSDWFSADYYSNSPANDPQGPSTGYFRIMRGGGWNSYAQTCRNAYREGGSPGNGYDANGFRFVVDMK
ncbi:MAG: hypothetical protein CSA15_02785, partial [Candidatus Delongbacteria bacterium]